MQETEALQNTLTLFVGGLNPETTEQDVIHKLSSMAKVSNVRLVKHKKTGLSRCFAFFNVVGSESLKVFLEPKGESHLGGRPLFF
jgi:RNA recognition motif-containing protein